MKFIQLLAKFSPHFGTPQQFADWLSAQKLIRTDHKTDQVKPWGRLKIDVYYEEEEQEQPWKVCIAAFDELTSAKGNITFYMDKNLKVSDFQINDPQEGLLIDELVYARENPILKF